MPVHLPTRLRITGLEPARGYHQNLNLARLPIPPYPHNCIKQLTSIITEELPKFQFFFVKLFTLCTKC